MSNLSVSVQAFLEQIQSWTITLIRQAKKLKSFKPQVHNKFKLNSIQIVLTEIEALQIKYKKIKNKYQPFLNHHDLPNHNISHQNQHYYSEELLLQYSQLSKSFMDILEKVSLIEGETNQPNYMLENDQSQHKINHNHKRKDKSVPDRKQGEKTFLNQTFSFKVSKQNKNHSNISKTNNNNQNKSIFDKRNSDNQKQQNTSLKNKAHSLIAEPNSKANNPLYNSKLKATTTKQHQLKPCSPANQDQDSSLWQIRHQLSKITQMMKQMKNQIKFHEHQETTKQINKIQNKNRKIASQLKSVKEQNRLMIDKLDDLKRQLMEEKKMQVDLINKFQKKTLLANYNTGLYDSRATHGEYCKSLNHDLSANSGKSPITNRKPQPVQNVSDWVKMRI